MLTQIHLQFNPAKLRALVLNIGDLSSDFSTARILRMIGVEFGDWPWE